MVLVIEYLGCIIEYCIDFIAGSTVNEGYQRAKLIGW